MGCFVDILFGIKTIFVRISQTMKKIFSEQKLQDRIKLLEDSSFTENYAKTEKNTKKLYVSEFFSIYRLIMRRE